MQGELVLKEQVSERAARLDTTEAAQLVLELAAQLQGQVVRPTFGELAESWLRVVRKKRVCPANEERHVRHLVDLIHLREGELTVSAIDEALSELGETLGPSTINKLRSTGALIIEAAQADGRWKLANPFRVLRRRREVKRAYVDLSFEEVAKMLRCVRRDRLHLVRVALYTGMRPGELFALERTDVDLERRSLHVHRSHERTSTKTGRERRIPIPNAVVEDLRAAIRSAPGDLVFPKDATGARFPRDAKLSRLLRHALVNAGVVTHWEHVCRRCKRTERHDDAAKRFCIDCGYTLWPVGAPKQVTFYDLRHLASTLHRRAGADALATKLVLGHAAIDVSDDVYTHFTEEDLRKEMNKLEGKLNHLELSE